MTDTGRVIDKLPDRCPVCKAEIVSGYGLMGGGIGPYWFCDTDGECPWFAKRQEGKDGSMGDLVEWR